jgi:hypothetical protein
MEAKDAVFVNEQHFLASNHAPISKKYENPITQNGHSSSCSSSISVSSNASISLLNIQIFN